jgi:hypothetical protein
VEWLSAASATGDEIKTAITSIQMMTATRETDGLICNSLCPPRPGLRR